MNKKLYIALAGISVAAGLTLSSCSDDKNDNGGGKPNDDPNSVALTLQADLLLKASPTLEFKDADEMNVYAKATRDITGQDLVSGVKAIKKGDKWELTPEVRISKGQNAYIFAVAPYNTAYTNPREIPVDMANQVDLLYSGAVVAASYTSNCPKVTMKHALALVTLNISSEGYSGAGELTSVAINGDGVFTKGKMDVSTGKITGTSKDPVTINTSATIQKGGWKTGHPNVWAIPFNTKTSEANLTVTIDGKTYVLAFPEVEMTTGFQYIFHLALTNYGLEFIPGSTQSIRLNMVDEGVASPEGHGLVEITTSSAAFTAPYFTGDNVFGNISWNGGSKSYSPGATLTVPANSKVTVETWNSTGFEIRSLDGIETIDMTNY